MQAKIRRQRADFHHTACGFTVNAGRGAQGPTKDQLYEEAKENAEGRSTMNKQELRKALGR